MLNLESIGMEQELLYETIITTKNHDNTPNAAPIGVVCKGPHEIFINLHKGSRTVENIKNEGVFIVNILKDPIIFTKSTLTNLSRDYFMKYGEHYYIKDSDAFFEAKVTHREDVEMRDQFGIAKNTRVKANVDNIVKNQEHVEPLNRAIYGVIEALVYLTRMNMVSGETENLYRHRMREITRIVNKVGGSKHKEAMKIIRENFNKYE